MSKKKLGWSSKSLLLAKQLHEELSIESSSWHQLKNDSRRRTAILLSSALCQLINDGNTPDIEALIDQSLLWLNQKIADPGCPKH